MGLYCSSNSRRDKKRGEKGGKDINVAWKHGKKEKKVLFVRIRQEYSKHDVYRKTRRLCLLRLCYSSPASLKAESRADFPVFEGPTSSSLHTLFSDAGEMGEPVREGESLM